MCMYARVCVIHKFNQDCKMALVKVNTNYGNDFRRCSNGLSIITVKIQFHTSSTRTTCSKHVPKIDFPQLFFCSSSASASSSSSFSSGSFFFLFLAFYSTE